MNEWHVVIPEATTNKCLNPSGEIAANFAAKAGTTVTRSTTYSFKGLYSYRVESNADTEGAEFTLSALANAVHYVTLMVRGTLPATWQWSLNNSDWRTPTVIRTEGSWSLYGYSFLAADANGSTTLHIRQSGAGSGDYYVDCIQVEEKAYNTTYCDGTIEGCTWSGTAHGSYSTRSAQSRAGGRVIDIETSYNLKATVMSGFGMSTLRLNAMDYSLLPGGSFQSTKTRDRSFTLIFATRGNSLANLHSDRKSLINALKPDLVYPEQPVRLRYTGAGKSLEIAAHYVGGLEGVVDSNKFERITANFIAYDPFFYELGDQAASLTMNQALANSDFSIKKVDGVWSAVATGALSDTVFAITRAPNGDVYIGGLFVNVGDANGDRIVKYDPIADTFTSLGTGAAGGEVRAIAIGPDGSIYAGGAFTSAGGVASTGYIAKWDGSVWTALGTGMNGIVDSLVFGLDGSLYAAGRFTAAGGVADTSRIAKWNGTAWSALGTGLNDSAYAVTVALDGSVYAGGAFTLASGVADTVRIAKWNGTAWSALSTGITGGSVFALAISDDGVLYAGGAFTSAGGNTCTRIAKWNGSAWSALGSGVNDNIYSLSINTNGLLYAGGLFTTAGGLSVADRIAIWNGTVWAHLDIDLPGTPYCYALYADSSRLYLGFDTSGSSSASIINAITNNGIRSTYPVFYFKRSGGTTMILQWIKNENTGKTLWFNYSLLDGEELTIDLSTSQKTITSSFFGDVRGRAILPGSDLSSWSLLPGANSVSVFCSESGTPTKTAYMIAKAPHWGVDGVAT